MKTIKIFAVPSHQTRERTSGVDYARVVQPMKHLDGYSNGEYKFKVDIFDIHDEPDVDIKSLEDYLEKSGAFWKKKVPNYDMIFFNYTSVDWHYATMATFARANGLKMVMDLDDALWYINKDNIAYDSLKEMGAGQVTTSILRDVDGITTTNKYLKNVIINETGVDYEKIGVFPNAVDLEQYNHISKPKDEHNVLLFYFGSTSHFKDLSKNDFVKGIDKVFAKYPNTNLKVIGANIGKLKMKWGPRYSYGYGHSDIYKWIKTKFPGFMDEADMMVVPLEDNLYNRCKSDIKFLESATAKIPGVFSDIRPYSETIKHGVNGYLAKKPRDWVNAVTELMDVKKRKEIGENAYKYVKSERTIQKLIPGYADYIIDVLTK